MQRDEEEVEKVGCDLNDALRFGFASLFVSLLCSSSTQRGGALKLVHCFNNNNNGSSGRDGAAMVDK